MNKLTASDKETKLKDELKKLTNLAFRSLSGEEMIISCPTLAYSVSKKI